MARGPGHPELSKSYMDMASKLLTFTSAFSRYNCHSTEHILGKAKTRRGPNVRSMHADPCSMELTPEPNTKEQREEQSRRRKKLYADRKRLLRQRDPDVAERLRRNDRESKRRRRLALKQDAEAHKAELARNALRQRMLRAQRAVPPEANERPASLQQRMQQAAQMDTTRMHDDLTGAGTIIVDGSNAHRRVGGTLPPEQPGPPAVLTIPDSPPACMSPPAQAAHAAAANPASTPPAAPPGALPKSDSPAVLTVPDSPPSSAAAALADPASVAVTTTVQGAQTRPTHPSSPQPPPPTPAAAAAPACPCQIAAQFTHSTPMHASQDSAEVLQRMAQDVLTNLKRQRQEAECILPAAKHAQLALNLLPMQPAAVPSSFIAGPAVNLLGASHDTGAYLPHHPPANFTPRAGPDGSPYIASS